MAHYTELREEIREQSKEIRTRETRSVASIALIAGYAFYADDGLILLSLIPAVIGVAFITHIGASIWLSRLASHVVRIQNLVDVEEFCWEREYGMYASEKFVGMVPYLAFYLTFAILYGSSIAVAYRIVQRTESTVLGYTPEPTHFLAFYILLTVLMILTAIAYLIDYKRNMPNRDRTRASKEDA